MSDEFDATYRVKTAGAIQQASKKMNKVNPDDTIGGIKTIAIFHIALLYAIAEHINEKNTIRTTKDTPVPTANDIRKCMENQYR